MVLGYEASDGIKSFLFYFLVIYMARAGETGLSWMALLSLYVLILFSLLCCVLFVYVPSFSFLLLGRPALTSPTLLSLMAVV